MFGRPKSDPVDWWLLGWQTSVMLTEAQAVIAMRLMGLAGVWTVTPSETLRMVTEKPVAYARAAEAAGRAAFAGKAPHLIAGAALKPVRRKTRANSRRLARGGPRRAAPRSWT
ncbi:antifreeze protein [Palleronia sp. KMU-117]|uniref:antifreeze protein n=1 Tax=Palleronia sp. KMU-117 TaxID=3434108 RepID=UPI003D71888E